MEWVCWGHSAATKFFVSVFFTQRGCTFGGCCVFGGVHERCIYLHARWSYRRRLRLMCPSSVERYYFPSFVDFISLPVSLSLCLASAEDSAYLRGLSGCVRFGSQYDFPSFEACLALAGWSATLFQDEVPQHNTDRAESAGIVQCPL